MNNLYLLFALCYFIAYSKNYARYCDPVEASSDAGYTTGVVTPEPCPQGYFCLLNTETKHEHPCPAGSYGNQTELESEAECNSCDGGFYCPTAGPHKIPSCYLIGQENLLSTIRYFMFPLRLFLFFEKPMMYMQI